MKSFIGAVIFICVAFSANAQLLWKVSGNGLTQPSYIIGTHHLAPFSIMDSIAGLQKAMNETQQVYGELKMSEMQSPATMGKMQKAMMIDSDTTTRKSNSTRSFKAKPPKTEKRWTVWKLPNSNSTCFSTVVHYNDKHSYSCALLII